MSETLQLLIILGIGIVALVALRIRYKKEIIRR